MLDPAVQERGELRRGALVPARIDVRDELASSRSAARLLPLNERLTRRWRPVSGSRPAYTRRRQLPGALSLKLPRTTKSWTGS